MTITELLRQEISEEFQRQGKAGLIVWYDRGGTLTSVVEKATPDDAPIVRFQGSYLALRFELENQDPNFDRRWLIYVPESPPKDSWLRDLELLGVRWEMDLLELLHRKADIPMTPRLIGPLRDHPQNSRDLVREWESLFAARGVTERSLVDGLLALCFGLSDWHIEQGMLSFLGGRVRREQLQTRGLWEVFKERIREATGWTEIPDDDNVLRQRLEAAILLSELVGAIPELAARFAGALPHQSARSAFGQAARNCREREDLRDCYLGAAQRIEREYELDTALTLSEQLLSVETFPLIDKLWQQEAANAVAPDGSNFGEKTARIGAIAEQRSKLFWARKEKAIFWEPVALAAKLYEGSHKAGEESQKLSEVGEFIHHYTADEGWWRLDLWSLELAAKVDTLSPEEHARFTGPAWRAYADYLDRANRNFAEAVERQGWTPTQPRFWSRFVTGQQRTTVFLVDALRYDLACLLKNLLRADEFEFNMDVLQAVLPGVTELGMAALLPDAEQGLKLEVEADQLRVFLGGEDVTPRQMRIAYLKSRLDHKDKVLDLDQVERANVKGVQSLVVLARELDEFGTFAADLLPQGLFEMVKQIARAVQRLKHQGFQRLLFVSDHGFLFLPPEVAPNKAQAPKAKVCKRRFAVGGTTREAVVKGAQELGLDSSEVFAFPRGLAVFGLPGETGVFVHGGLSLQENFVPVLEAKVVAPTKKVSVVMDVPSQLTSRIVSITLRVKEPVLFAEPRRVVVEINGRRSDAFELSLSQQDRTIQIPWLSFEEQPPAAARIRLIDADSKSVLEEHEVKVNMVV